jgi:recombination protein RecT
MKTQNTLQTKTPAKITMSTYLSGETIKAKINSMFASNKESQKFISSILSAVSANKQLNECDNATIFSSALLANSLNLSLSPQLGLAYIVPFKDNRNDRSVATFILGYKGYIQLAIRSGYYRHINVIEIKKGEFKSYNPLTEVLDVELIQDDEIRENTPTVGYYAMFELTNGFTKTMYWSKKKMIEHADRYSKAFSKNATAKKVSFADFEAGKVSAEDMWKYSSYWYQSFDDMALKTMIRQLISKWGIMSIDMQTAYEMDSKTMSDVEMVSGDDEGEYQSADVVNVEASDAKVVESETTIEDTAVDVEAGFFGETVSK